MSRLGPLVRERTKLLAALMRTPDDGLLTFAQAHNLSEEIEIEHLVRVRDLLDVLAAGLHQDPNDPFWDRLDAALAQLQGRGLSAHGVAPVPPPPVAVAPVPESPSAPDFRHEVMETNPPVRKPATSRKRRRAWKPANPNVRRPAPDQENTELLETGMAGTLKLPASTPTADWPLKKVVRLEAAYTAYVDKGDPSIEDICQFFELPNERAIRIALEVWRRRIEQDEELAAEHDELLDTIEDEG